MQKIESFLEQKLQERSDNGSLRSLSTQFLPIDFCSNDYLGFAKSTTLSRSIDEALLHLPDYRNGAAGSRLLSGNTAFTEETEQVLADYHVAESGLLYNSGYDANLGLLSSVPQRGDTILTDELIHASIIDGCRLSHANRLKFEHNNLSSLEDKLKLAKGNIFVVVESVYSMDGDIAPLTDLASLCEKYEANLIVDEAHATGIFGRYGNGLVNQFGLENKVFARIITFGKALGVHGAIILGSKKMRSYLINFSRSFIYTTAAPIHSVLAIRMAYQQLKLTDQQCIHEKIALFRSEIEKTHIPNLPSISTIQGILFPSNQAAKEAASFLQSNNFDVRAILSPTVPIGKERLRMCLHTFNTDEEIISLVDYLKRIIPHG
ncbi:aminotransferase class I/II-fold pyridoxal phosphate-dependent enzyme [Pedobacter sp. MW01-1-1]|uniref:aminotransferase class I/II-fold pyridoxal phosphate-dependent enzyme n=1 Tax=Pedobacter sp. MW01-1-1 TaxID=3383027 RepID=UPI003FEDBC88